LAALPYPCLEPLPQLLYKTRHEEFDTFLLAHLTDTHPISQSDDNRVTACFSQSQPLFSTSRPIEDFLWRIASFTEKRLGFNLKPLVSTASPCAATIWFSKSPPPPPLPPPPRLSASSARKDSPARIRYPHLPSATPTGALRRRAPLRRAPPGPVLVAFSEEGLGSAAQAPWGLAAGSRPLRRRLT